MTIKKLQNGSDIRGVVLPGVKGEVPNLGEKETSALTFGYLTWLSKTTEKPFSKLTIAVGMDPRLSGPALKGYIVNTLASFGAKVLDCGLATTPAMFMSTVFDEFSADGSLMITASHLPFNRNGFKYFDRNGGLNKGDISEIICIAENDFVSQAETSYSCNLITEVDLMKVYCNHLRQMIISGVPNNDPVLPLKGMKILVDAGNGGGGFYATKVLEPLGADISGSQFLDPDGRFPNHAPNPEDPDAMASICSAVKSNHVDLGLIFDTDVDRSAAVDNNGNPISRNEIVALAAALVSEENPGSTVVTDSVTSNQVTDFIENILGLKHLRFKRGYKNVINKSIELNKENINSPLAIETSGHAAFKSNYFLDDGAYLSTQIVIKAANLKLNGTTIDNLISSLEKPVESREIRMNLTTDDFAQYGDNILLHLEDWVQTASGLSLVTPNYEGVRINFDSSAGNGWALLRKSLHDPIMPLNIESNEAGGCDKIASKLMLFLSRFERLDSSDL